LFCSEFLVVHILRLFKSVTVFCIFVDDVYIILKQRSVILFQVVLYTYITCVEVDIVETNQHIIIIL